MKTMSVTNRAAVVIPEAVEMLDRLSPSRVLGGYGT